MSESSIEDQVRVHENNFPLLQLIHTLNTEFSLRNDEMEEEEGGSIVLTANAFLTLDLCDKNRSDTLEFVLEHMRDALNLFIPQMVEELNTDGRLPAIEYTQEFVDQLLQSVFPTAQNIVQGEHPLSKHLRELNALTQSMAFKMGITVPHSGVALVVDIHHHALHGLLWDVMFHPFERQSMEQDGETVYGILPVLEEESVLFSNYE